ncbi:hypothetical protein OE88DRAFT_1405377 [Heliocybe sulcata]|uniref:GSKIP domain-containing protein n=1 Tax=Heliocybe sulcata TaxID=5364 RepID=A0A5C3N5K2_9AGAM|nr:hypothetical protein OE88DRAFT_1405377 [Heliocybe sulcata]
MSCQGLSDLFPGFFRRNKGPSPASLTSMSPPTCFYRDELRKILSEQSFGISSFNITGHSAEDATASIRLLEDRSVTVVLTARGYQVASSGPMYESLESLLRSISPMYAQKYQDVLVSKLGQLADD